MTVENFYSTRTNELTITLNYGSTGQPLLTATVDVEILDGDDAVSGSATTLTNLNDGRYYNKYAILPIEANRSYNLHVVVTVSGSEVINETVELITI